MHIIATKKCSVDNCGRKFYAKSFCKLHYRRFIRTGTHQLLNQLIPPISKEELEELSGRYPDCEFIKLTQGKITIVDKEDYDVVMGCLKHVRWSIWHNAGNYARLALGSDKVLFIHRLVVNCPEGLRVDHINGDTLDNRKCNLRICDANQNIRNRKKPKHNTSGFKGVVKIKNYNKWSSQISYKGEHKYLGYYNSKEQAAMVYDIWALFYHGEFARTNRMMGLL